MSNLQHDLRRKFPQIADFIQTRDGRPALVDNETTLAVLLSPDEWTGWENAIYDREFDRHEVPDYYALYTNLFGEHRIGDNTDYDEHLFMVSIISNVKCLNEGIIRELYHINAHCVYPLLRTWMERCALIIYVTDNPQYIKVMEGVDKEALIGNSSLMQYALARSEDLRELHDSLSGAMLYKSERMLLPFTNADTQEYTNIVSHTDQPQEDDLDLEEHIAVLSELSLRLIEGFIETRVLKYCKLEHDGSLTKI